MPFRLFKWVNTTVLGLTLLAGSSEGQTNGLTNLWSEWQATPLESGPAVGQDDTIYFGTFRGELIALRSEDSKKWRYKTGSEIHSAPAVADDGTVYFGCRDRHLYALAANGKLKWRFKTGGWVDASPALGADGSVYFGSWDKKFYALNADGSLKWDFVTGNPVTGSAAITSDGTVYFGSHDRNFYALRPDGSKLWELSTGGAIVSSPAIATDGTVYFTSVDGRLYAATREGSLKWTAKIGCHSKSSPVIDPEGNVYACGNGTLVSLDPAGKPRWEVTLISSLTAQSTPVITADGRVFIHQYHGGLASYSLSGKLLSDVWADGLAEAPSTINTNGQLNVVADYGTIRSYQTFSSPADSAWPMFQHDARHTGRAAH